MTMLATAVIEHLEAPYASSLVLVKKPDGNYICSITGIKLISLSSVSYPTPQQAPYYPNCAHIGET